MSFASDVKLEACKTELTSACCARAELAGMLCFGAVFKPAEIRLRTENGMVARRFYNLIEFHYHLRVSVSMTEAGVFCAVLQGGEALKVLRDVKVAGIPVRIDREVVRSACCKAALVRGAFLGGGSMANPSKSYHCELMTAHYALCADFRKVLRHFEIYPKIINRNGNYVFYIKESAQIENLLAAIGAHGKMMELLNVKIEKDIRNTTNRIVNCELANSGKVAAAAVRQKTAIEKITAKSGWQSLSPELEAVARLRMENTEISLAEIAAVLGISKSGVNHRMRKILSLAEMEEDGV